jgi:hypothetical protein
MWHIISEYIYIDNYNKSVIIKYALMKVDNIKNNLSPVLIRDTREELLVAIEKQYDISLLDTKKAQVEQKISPEVLEVLKEEVKKSPKTREKTIE